MKLWTAKLDDDGSEYETVVLAPDHKTACRLAASEMIVDWDWDNPKYGRIRYYDTLDELIKKEGCWDVWERASEYATDCPRCRCAGKDVGLNWRSCGVCGYRWVGFEDPEDRAELEAAAQATIDGLEAWWAEIKKECKDD